MRADVMHYGLWLVVLFGLPVQAASIDVTAEYNPAAYEVGYGKFINTTPCLSESWSGFWCSDTSTVDQSQPLFISITIDRVVKNNNNLIDALTYLAFVGARDVSLVHQNSGKSYPLKFFFTKIGALMSPNIAKEALVNNTDWLDHIDGDCQHSLNTYASPSQVHYLYDIKPENQLAGGKCYHNKFKTTFSSKSTALKKIYLGYKLKAPDPLKMENGVYKGSLVLSIGRNKDLDFGNGTYSDSQLTINFTMKVRHQIKIDFPPGGDKVVLLPPGGWSDWIYRGKNRVPSSLRADLHYRIWFSSKIKVTLSCEYPNGSECFIKNTKDGHLVPIHVYWRDYSLITTTTAGLVFAPSVDGTPAVNADRFFSFKITDSQVLKEMMKRPGGTYKGKVTIIFDATI
ncbi:hypothetical protein MM182_14665 [Aeromonas sp. MR19]|uniref:hypothetical protein n=1 Tax=Aeromonas sp. MR19 TaxID=2923421 RepID=UPI001F4A45ED|nr:hypothetical protein [Aeromonas sp. MR19]MCH7376598.1 hypothetical protein [Aeromonas sp. MR19]